jgi:hypothetical protein
MPSKPGTVVEITRCIAAKKAVYPFTWQQTDKPLAHRHLPLLLPVLLLLLPQLLLHLL